MPIFRPSRAKRQLRRRSAVSFKQLALQHLEHRLALSAVAWTGASGDSWDVASNWSTGAVPGPGDDVTIDTSAALTITIQSGDNIAVNSVTTGANDTLSITGGSLTVSAGASTLAGPLDMTGGSLTASGSGTAFTANGATTVSGGSLNANGGGVTSLPELAASSVNALSAAGAGSVLNLPVLTSLTPPRDWSPYISATDGGAIKLPVVTSLDDTHILDTGGSSIVDTAVTNVIGADVSLDGSDAGLAAAWTHFTSGELSVDGGAAGLPVLTDADGSSLHALDGGKLTVADLADAYSLVLRASGTGSVLNLPSLRSVANETMSAEQGGEIDVPKLAAVTADPNNNGFIWDTGGGSLVDGSLTTLSGVSVSLDGTDVNVANAWTSLTNSILMVTGGAVTLPALTDFDGSQLSASAAGTAAMPVLTSYVVPEFLYSTAFKADGPGSAVDLTALTNVTQGQGGAFNVAATNGGDIEMPALTTVSSSGTQTLPASFTGNGTISDDKLTTLASISVSLDGNYPQIANSWTSFTNGSLTVTGGSYDLSNLKDADGSSLDVQNGATLKLPSLTQYAADSTTFKAQGTGSLLDASALTAVTEPGGWSVVSYPGDSVDLSALAEISSTSHSALSFGGGGTIVAGKLTTLDGVDVTLDGSEPEIADSWTSLTNGSLTLWDAGAITLPHLTDADGSDLTAHSYYATSVLSLPALTSYSGKGTFDADYGTLDVSALTSIAPTSELTVDVGNYAKVDLSGLTSLNSSNGSISMNDTGYVASLLLSSKLTTLDGINVSLSGDAHVADAWTIFTHGALNVTGGSYTLPALTDIDGSSLSASNGGSLTLPNVTSYDANGAFSADGP